MNTIFPKDVDSKGSRAATREGREGKGITNLASVDGSCPEIGQSYFDHALLSAPEIWLSTGSTQMGTMAIKCVPSSNKIGVGV